MDKKELLEEINLCSDNKKNDFFLKINTLLFGFYLSFFN